MEYLATVRDGSTGELHPGYWLCDVTAAEVNGSEIVPLYQKLFSVEAQDFRSENAEILAAIDLVRKHTEGRGIWTVDRGGDRKKLLEPLLDRSQRFVIRSTGKRTVIDRRHLQGSVAEVAGRCRLRHQARIIKIQDGHEKTYDLRYGAEPIRLPGRSEQLWLLVVAGFGEEPLMLLTDLPVLARDSQTLWWIVQIYLTRWKIGVSSQGHIVQSVQDRPRSKDSDLVAGEASWRESKTAEPSDNMLGKECAQRTRLQRAVNADVASLHESPVAETVDNAVSGKCSHRHQGGGSGRSTVDGRAAKRARREGPGPVSTPLTKVRQG